MSLQPPAGTMATNTNTAKHSRLQIGATTVSVSQEKLSVPIRPVMEVSHEFILKQFLTVVLQVMTASAEL